MNEDPLAKLFVSAEWMKGYKAGREYEKALADQVLAILSRKNAKSEASWRRDILNLARLRRPKTGKFGLKTGSVILRKQFDTRDEAEAFADFNSKGRGGYTVVEL